MTPQAQRLDRRLDAGVPGDQHDLVSTDRRRARSSRSRPLPSGSMQVDEHDVGHAFREESACLCDAGGGAGAEALAAPPAPTSPLSCSGRRRREGRRPCLPERVAFLPSKEKRFAGGHLWADDHIDLAAPPQHLDGRAGPSAMIRRSTLASPIRKPRTSRRWSQFGSRGRRSVTRRVRRIDHQPQHGLDQQQHAARRPGLRRAGDGIRHGFPSRGPRKPAEQLGQALVVEGAAGVVEPAQDRGGVRRASRIAPCRRRSGRCRAARRSRCGSSSGCKRRASIGRACGCPSRRRCRRAGAAPPCARRARARRCRRTGSGRRSS